jgi:hypothetical protein
MKLSLFHRVIPVCFQLAAATLTSVALGQIEPADVESPETSPVEAAREHFRRGVDLYRDGAFDAASVEFSRAYEIAPNYRILYNIAQVQAERHDHAAALAQYEAYLAAGGTELSAERIQEVRTEIQRMRSRVATLVVRSEPAGVTLLVDGESRGLAQGNLVVNSGARALRAEKPGYETVDMKVELAGGDLQRVTFQLVPRSTEPVGVSPTAGSMVSQDTSSASGYGYAPFVGAAAVTVALGGASGVFGWLALRSEQRLKDELNRFPLDQAARSSASKNTKTYALLCDSFGGGAILGLAVSIYFLATASPAHDAAKPQAAAQGLGVTGLGVANNQLVVSGSF